MGLVLCVLGYVFVKLNPTYKGKNRVIICRDKCRI
jgi:hypothetical protein